MSVTPATTRPLSPLVEAYLVDRRADGGITSKESTRPMRSILGRFLEVVGDRLPDLGAADVEEWLSTQAGDSPNTVRVRVSVVRPFCRWMVANGHASADPTVTLDVGKRWSRAKPAPLPTLVPAPPAELVVPEVVEAAFCGDCGRASDQLKRVAGTGRRLCTVCYQRARRAKGPDAVLGHSVSVHLHRELTALGLGSRTVQVYARTIQGAERWFIEHGWTLATALPWQIVAYLETRPCTWSTRNLMRSAFKTYWELVGHPKPPLRAMRVPPKPEMVCKALDDEDARALATAARDEGGRHGLAVILGLYQGLRREEIATTRWGTVDEAGWLTVMGKGSKRRRIPLHAVTLEALKAVQEARDDTSELGVPWSIRWPGKPGDRVAVGPGFGPRGGATGDQVRGWRCGGGGRHERRRGSSGRWWVFGKEVGPRHHRPVAGRTSPATGAVHARTIRVHLTQPANGIRPPRLTSRARFARARPSLNTSAKRPSCSASVGVHGSASLEMSHARRPRWSGGHG